MRLSMRLCVLRFVVGVLLVGTGCQDADLALQALGLDCAEDPSRCLPVDGGRPPPRVDAGMPPDGAADAGTPSRWNPICGADNWCWQNPLPQINDLKAVGGSDVDHIWAVGESGMILMRDRGTYSMQRSGTTKDLYAIWAADASNAWAVGAAGTILKWNGLSWSAQPSGTTLTLGGVWGTDTNNIWAVGAGGMILKWNGSMWTPQASSTTESLASISGFDTKSAWAVGAQGVIV